MTELVLCVHMKRVLHLVIDVLFIVYYTHAVYSASIVPVICAFGFMYIHVHVRYMNYSFMRGIFFLIMILNNTIMLCIVQS